MARNFIFEGDRIPFTATAAVSSGDGVAIGVMLGVALSNVAVGETGVAGIEDCWTLPKDGATAVSAGDKLAWSVAGGQIIASGAGVTGDLDGCAVAIADAAAADPTVRVKLTPGVATIAP